MGRWGGSSRRGCERGGRGCDGQEHAPALRETDNSNGRRGSVTPLYRTANGRGTWLPQPMGRDRNVALTGGWNGRRSSVTPPYRKANGDGLGRRRAPAERRAGRRLGRLRRLQTCATRNGQRQGVVPSPGRVLDLCLAAG